MYRKVGISIKNDLLFQRQFAYMQYQSICYNDYVHYCVNDYGNWGWNLRTMALQVTVTNV